MRKGWNLYHHSFFKPWAVKKKRKIVLIQDVCSQPFFYATISLDKLKSQTKITELTLSFIKLNPLVSQHPMKGLSVQNKN